MLLAPTAVPFGPLRCMHRYITLTWFQVSASWAVAHFSISSCGYSQDGLVLILHRIIKLLSIQKRVWGVKRLINCLVGALPRNTPCTSFVYEVSLRSLNFILGSGSSVVHAIFQWGIYHRFSNAAIDG